MTRTINMHLEVGVPDTDGRDTLEIVDAVMKELESRPNSSPIRDLTIETVFAEVIPHGEPITIYTVHPFDDEWTWDSGKSGSHPWATPSLQEAIDHANLVRLEYASVPDTDREWLAGFWSSIYAEAPDDPDSADEIFGWVDPDGNFTEGSEPPIDAVTGAWLG